MGLVFRTDWADVPHTNEHARPLAFERVEGARTVFVERASYRDALLENVSFELAPEQKDLPEHAGSTTAKALRVKVLCLWYGRFPPAEQHITVTVHGKYRKGSGGPTTVVRDIGSRLPDPRPKPRKGKSKAGA